MQILMVSTTNFLSSERTEADNSTMTVKQPLLLWEEKAYPWISVSKERERVESKRETLTVVAVALD